jgi:hypothetical protein
MTRLDSLRALYKKVEAGTLPDGLVCPIAFADDFDNGYCCMKAYHGSVDAALSLRQSLLPQWTALELRSRNNFGRWVADLSRMDGDREVYATGYAATASSAMLQAILVALIAEEEARHPIRAE